MSKGKLFGIGLAGILSVVSVGCTNKQADAKSEEAPMVEKGVKSRQQNGREDISVSFIKRDKDYVKSVNCLLSLYRQIIPMVEKNAGRMGIDKAMTEAYKNCHLRGYLNENSVAYNFVDIVAKNYDGSNVAAWKKGFETAGKESEKILGEGDKVSRKYVPVSLSGKAFLRRCVGDEKSDWQTADQAETWNNVRQFHDRSTYGK